MRENKFNIKVKKLDNSDFTQADSGAGHGGENLSQSENIANPQAERFSQSFHFQQSLFWAQFKAAHGWSFLRFEIEILPKKNSDCGANFPQEKNIANPQEKMDASGAENIANAAEKLSQSQSQSENIANPQSQTQSENIANKAGENAAENLSQPQETAGRGCVSEKNAGVSKQEVFVLIRSFAKGLFSIAYVPLFPNLSQEKNIANPQAKTQEEMNASGAGRGSEKLSQEKNIANETEKNSAENLSQSQSDSGAGRGSENLSQSQSQSQSQEAAGRGDFGLRLSPKDFCFLLKELSLAIKEHLPKNTVCVRFDPALDFSSPGERDAFVCAAKKAARKSRVPVQKSRVDIQPPDTTQVDLGRSEEEILSSMKSKWRYNINLAARKGVKIEKISYSEKEFCEDFAEEGSFKENASNEKSCENSAEGNSNENYSEKNPSENSAEGNPNENSAEKKSQNEKSCENFAEGNSSKNYSEENSNENYSKKNPSENSAEGNSSENYSEEKLRENSAEKKSQNGKLREEPRNSLNLSTKLDSDNSSQNSPRNLLNLSAKVDSGLPLSPRILLKLSKKVDEFYEIYKVTSDRDGISIHSKKYYEDLLKKSFCEKAASPKITLYIARSEGEALAAIITLFSKTEAAYLYGASSNEKRNLMPNFLLQWTAMRDAKAAGSPLYDLYGMPPTDDPSHPMHGLYKFKTGFGGKSVHRAGTFDFPLKIIYGPLIAAERARAFWHKVLKKKIRGR